LATITRLNHFLATSSRPFTITSSFEVRLPLIVCPSSYQAHGGYPEHLQLPNVCKSNSKSLRERVLIFPIFRAIRSRVHQLKPSISISTGLSHYFELLSFRLLSLLFCVCQLSQASLASLFNHGLIVRLHIAMARGLHIPSTIAMWQSRARNSVLRPKTAPSFIAPKIAALSCPSASQSRRKTEVAASVNIGLVLQ
jgi:hypothetical protein